MAIFDKKGMLIIPNPNEKAQITGKRTLVINELYCPQGHSLLSSRANFDGYAGILFKVSGPGKQGFVALSPIIGQSCRIALDVELVSGDVMDFRCPICDTVLPVYAPCSCGGNLIALFLTKECHFNDVLGICNRVDCKNFRLVQSGELITAAMLSQL
jgi:hypothetical protein